MGHGECVKERVCLYVWTWKPTLNHTSSPGATIEKIWLTQLTTLSPHTHMHTGLPTRACTHLHLSVVLWSVFFQTCWKWFFFFFFYSYNSQLKLVRLKVSESGVYTFLASNVDASIQLTFEVHVLSKFLRNTYLVAICERNQGRAATASVCHVTRSSVLLRC